MQRIEAFHTSENRRRWAAGKRGQRADRNVDGGIDAATAPQAIDAGATVLVAGTAAFRGGPDQYAANIAALRGGE